MYTDDLFLMVDSDGDVTILWVERGFTMENVAEESAHRCNRTFCIKFTVPEEDCRKRNFYEIEIS